MISISIWLLEETGGNPAEGGEHWHESIALWPVLQGDSSEPPRFVDILTDSDGDGIGDVNERLAGTSPDDAASSPDETVIDLLALYTAEYAEAESGYPYTRLLHAISSASAIYEDSAANLRFRLVGMSEVELDAASWADREVRKELMDSHGADVSVQFSRRTPCPGAGGCVSNFGASRTSQWIDNHAAAWVGNTSALTTAHELGHVMGLAHSARQGEAAGAWRWSRGHYVTPRGEPRSGTVMTYGAGVFGGVLSDPQADCGATPCGVAARELDGADSVATLNLLRFQIGAHREPAIDSDGDGVVDAADAVPDDPGDWFDVDGDGIGDNADPDDDNDGTPDVDDAFPLDGAEWEDADGDGVGDNSDDEILDLTPFRDPALRTVVEEALGKEPGAPITPEDLAGLSELQAYSRDIRDLTGLDQATELESLYLAGNPIDDLGPLAELTRLRYLGLEDNAVEDLTPLSSLIGLQVLHLSGNPVHDLKPLSRLTALQSLDVSRTNVALADVLEIPYVGDLGVLGLVGLGISDVSALSELTALSWLSLHDNDITDIGPLASLVQLSSLDLSGNQVRDIGPLASLVQLSSLDLSGNQVRDIAPLRNLVNLGVLGLVGLGISDVSALSELTALSRLSLHDNDITDIGPLASLVQLWSLDLSGNQVRDIGPLASLVQLSSLQLSGNQVRDIGPLASLVQLSLLQLSGNQVRDIAPLRNLVNLWSLDLADNRVSDIAPLKNMAALRWLSLADNRVSDIAPLRNLLNLRSLFLEGNPLDTSSIEEHIPTLESWGIHVGYTKTGNSGTAAGVVDPTLLATIAETLAVAFVHVDTRARELALRPLWELHLYGLGVADLAGLEAATELTWLHAAANRIADLSPLANLAKLYELDLRHNRVSDISPLVANAGLGEGDRVGLDGNPLSEVSLNTHVPALLDRGVKVSVGSVALALMADGAAVRFDVSGYFEALLGAGPALTATSADLSLATAEVTDGALVVEPGARAGTVRVTVEATNSGGETAALEFLVRVRGPWLVPLVPNASGPRQGFVRVVNHDGRAGEVRIQPVDEAGQVGGGLSLAIGAGETVQFNSRDLEMGNAGKGLTGSSGRGTGDWRLELRSDLDLDVLAYMRTPDGFLTSIHDVAPRTESGHLIPTFNPASNTNQRSLLRVSNLGGEDAEATISGVDDDGRSPGTEVRVHVPAGASLQLTADDLEAGAPGLAGALGEGRGKWRLALRSAGELSVMSLLASPGGHLTNLSTAAPAALEADGVHAVPLFPSASDELGRRGFVRVVNRFDSAGEVRIVAYDDTGLAYDPLTLALEAGKTQHFNSNDLEFGNADKGISGSTGRGTGDWRLELSSELDIAVLAYVRAPGGFLTSMHDVVRGAGRRYDVATFNPGSNTNQVSALRIVNPGARPAHAAISGIDHGGESPGDVIRLTVPAGGSVTVTAQQLEVGDSAFYDGRGGIGNGRGKWRLQVDSEQPVFLVNLLASPTGHLTNLSTSPNR